MLFTSLSLAGYKAAGDATALQELGSKYGLQVSIVDLIADVADSFGAGAHHVSSTKVCVRACVRVCVSLSLRDEERMVWLLTWRTAFMGTQYAECSGGRRRGGEGDGGGAGRRACCVCGVLCV